MGSRMRAWRRRAAMALLAAAGLLACCQPGVADDETQFPYTAYIHSPDVYIRSGPGENYYPVQKLQRGDAVEVYRHDPGGWYAIRPPEKSFSWISGEFLEIEDDSNLATVSGDRVVARVGSVYSDIRDVIQIRLDRGERVKVLEAQRFNEGPAAQTWYKISPPPGEFRWVSGKFVSRELETPAPKPRGPHNNLLLSRNNREDAEADEADAEDEEAEEEEVEEADGEPALLENVEEAERVAHEEEADDRPRKGKRPPKRRPRQASNDRSDDARDDESDVESDEEDPDAEEQDGDDADASPLAGLRVRPPRKDLKEEVEEIDLILSAIVAEETTEWDFSDLKPRAESALERSQTALERGRARRVLKKIEQFEDLARRYQSIAKLKSETDRRDRQLSSQEKSLDRSLVSRESNRFDGAGKLMQVVVDQPGGPQFALLNDQGEVVCYVSAAPGVNLRRYMGKQVGVTGSLGYLPEQHAQHITARRLESLDTLTR